MGSRGVPLARPSDSPKDMHERLVADDASDSTINGERSPLTSREQNGGVGSASSPVGTSPLGTTSAGSGRREMFIRSVSGSKYAGHDDVDLEDGTMGEEREKTLRKSVKIQNQALISGFAYCICSCSMILINKYVLSGYDFNAGISLMLYQNIVSVVIVSTLSMFGVISTEPLTWRLIRVWLPVNAIFVGMLITSIFSLKYINIAMVTVLKNVTNVITAIGEIYLFKKHHDNKVWAALVLMIISAISGGMTDIQFHAIGYAWQILNCFLTASYSLTLRRVMDTAKHVTKSGNLNEFSMVLLNNVLSLPLGALLIFAFNEVEYISKTLVGSLNKIPLSIAGIVLFKVPTSVENFVSILFGLLAGVFFAKAKMRERSQS